MRLLKPIRVQMLPLKALGVRHEATGVVCLVLLGFGLALVGLPLQCFSVPFYWNDNVYFTPVGI